MSGADPADAGSGPGCDVVRLGDWANRVDAILRRTTLFDRATILAETDSTQDAAVRLGCRPGLVVAAGRQLAGRGRRGRAWSDHATANLAVTFVVRADRSPMPSVRSAVAVAEVIAGMVVECSAASSGMATIGIKWPNDILANECKLAGILIEQDELAARIGVGINVQRRTWPDDLIGKATSAEELMNRPVRRIEVLERLILAFDEALTASEAVILDQYARRDVLAGTRAAFEHNDIVVRGIVRSVDPNRGLVVESEPDGEVVFLPASATSRLG